MGPKLFSTFFWKFVEKCRKMLFLACFECFWSLFVTLNIISWWFTSYTIILTSYKNNWQAHTQLPKFRKFKKNARRVEARLALFFFEFTEFINLAHAFTWTGACVYMDRRIRLHEQAHTFTWTGAYVYMNRRIRLHGINKLQQ